MKTLTVSHLDRLDALYLEEYFEACVQDLIDIDFTNPYPPKKQDYLKFVTHVYGVAKKYNLDNEKYAFALMLAWHVRGQNFVREKRVVELLNSQTLTPHTKYQELMQITMKTLDAYIENEKEITDE